MPDPPAHGYWFKIDNNAIHLECNPGYVPAGISLAECKEEVWSPSTDRMTCSEGMIMITGGKAENSTMNDFLDNIEAFLPADIGFKAPSLPYSLGMHSLGYVDGKVIACGGRNDTRYSTGCLQFHTKGKIKVS